MFLGYSTLYHDWRFYAEWWNNTSGDVGTLDDNI